MANEIVAKPTAELSSAIEQVVIGGDLSALNPEQRVQYYNTVCQSVGLNPYTRPFDYIKLNGKLTLYARKDATDQLRKINAVNIEDIKTEDDGDWFVVTVKGSDRTGRRDVEIGAVNKKDMQGNFGNAMMKAVTKAKRRLTLSLCGLGWLDETEIETIRDARPVIVNDEGVIVEQARIESKTVEVENPINNTPAEQKPAEAQEKPKFDEDAFLKEFVPDGTLPYYEYDEACQVKDSTGRTYGSLKTEELFRRIMGCQRGLKKADLTEDQEDILLHKLGSGGFADGAFFRRFRTFINIAAY